MTPSPPQRPHGPAHYLAPSEELLDFGPIALSAISNNRFKSATKTAQDLIFNASAVWIELRICSNSGSKAFMRRTPDRYQMAR
jgi:hypothetical protein